MRHNPVKAHFFIHEVVVLTGFSKYMLDYLFREDIFRPSSTGRGRGHRRHYSYQDVVSLRALHAVCRGQGRIKHLKEALVAFRAQLGQMKPGQRLDQLLFVLGDELCVRTERGASYQLRTGQQTFSFVVDLATVTQDVARSVEVDPRSGLFRLRASDARKAEKERERIWAPIRERREAAG